MGEENRPEKGSGAERGRRPSVAPEPRPIQRWSKQRKKEVVLRLLRGESIEEVSREVGVEVYRLAEWRDRALIGIDSTLKERSKDDPVQAELDAAHRQIGEITMENELLRRKIERMERRDPLRRGRSRK
jgi:transposase-like protein